MVLSDVFRVYEYIYRRRKEVGGAMRGPRGWGARLPTSWPPRCFVDLYSKSPRLRLFQKNILVKVCSIWIPFDIPFLRNTKIGKKTATGTGPPVNRLVPKII